MAGLGILQFSCFWFSPCSKRFSLGSPVFLAPQKPSSNATKIEDSHEKQRMLMSLPLLILIVIYLIFTVKNCDLRLENAVLGRKLTEVFF